MRWLLIASLLLAPLAARANNAFPDELEAFAPPSLPNELVVGTNYGVIFSQDDGQSWSWVCEPAVSSKLVTAYGVTSDGGFYALADDEVLSSSDQGCSWTGVQPASDVATMSDLFADPGDPQHALAIGYSTQSGAFELFDTHDRGATWTGPVLATAAGPLLGVEISRSNPARAYASEYRSGLGTVVHVSNDHGATWTEIDHAELGDVFPFVAAIDPTDASTLWLRLVSNGSATGDQIAVSHDSGATFTVMLTAPSALSALAVGEDHTVWTADRTNDLWRLDPDAGSFVLGAGPSVRCLVERAGVLYACGDPSDGGYVFGASTDRGLSFTGLVTSTSYQTLACTITNGACTAINAKVDAGSNPSADAGSSTTAPGKSGCGCGIGADGSALALGSFALLALIARRGRSSRRAFRARRSGRW